VFGGAAVGGKGDENSTVGVGVNIGFALSDWRCGIFIGRSALWN